MYVENTINFNLLEEISAIVVTEERYGVSQHPNVTAAAVVVRLGPLAVLVRH